MHSFDAPSGATYFHNGDFSGEVQFTAEVEGDYVDEFEEKTVNVPFADLKALVAKHVRNAKINTVEDRTGGDTEAVSRLEQMTDDRVLGLDHVVVNVDYNPPEHNAHRAVLALRGMLVAAGVGTSILNEVTGPLSCASCHLEPIS